MSSVTSPDESIQRCSQESELLRIAKKFNRFHFRDAENQDRCRPRPLYCNGHAIGLVRQAVADCLCRHPDVFDVQTERIDIVISSDNLSESELYDEVTSKVAQVLTQLRRDREETQDQTTTADDPLVALRGWRNEDYEIRSGGFKTSPLFRMERSATPLFGVRQYGVDINGYVRDPEKGLMVWIQKRSANKPTWPDKWDNFVSGGLSVGRGVADTAVKEANEEANVPQELAQTMTPAGAVSCFFESERGLFPNTEYVFDLELPSTFSPKNNDGEVDDFALVTAPDLLKLICDPTFKTTSCHVALDFLVRHGVVTPENEPNYAEIVELLHLPIHIEAFIRH